MNIREFKAWLEGFEEAIEGAPTESQWKKLKEKLAQVGESDGSILEAFRKKVEQDRECWKPKWPDSPWNIRNDDKIFLEGPGLPDPQFAPYSTAQGQALYRGVTIS